VSTSEVAEYMTTTFAEFRQATRSVVEQHLSATRLSSSQDESDVIAIDVPSADIEPQPVSREVSRSAKGTRSGVTEVSSAVAPRSGRNIWLAALGTLLLGLAIYLFFARKPEPPPLPPTTVEVSIAASPTTATLTLDGERLPGNPSNGRFPRDTKPHSLLVEAEGYVSQTMGLQLTENRSVAVTLVALPPPAPAPAAEAPSAPSPEAAAPGKAPTSSRLGKGRKPVVVVPTPGTVAPRPSATARPNCTPPYTIDANGFKVYKPGCL
jgi:serine/threonine-protein kinase